MTEFNFIRKVPGMFLIFCFIVVVFFSVIILTWLKGDARKLPVTLAIAHFIAVAFFSIIILIWVKHNEEAGMAWVIFVFLDWPISAIFKGEWIWRIWTPIFKLPIISSISDIINVSVVMPFINFGILGTAQYYIWGLIVSKILLFLKR